eukprot:5578617-Amphidinium_carterae.1
MSAAGLLAVSLWQRRALSSCCKDTAQQNDVVALASVAILRQLMHNFGGCRLASCAVSITQRQHTRSCAHGFGAPQLVQPVRIAGEASSSSHHGVAT